METTRNAGSCCGHHGATSAPAHRTAAPAPQGYTPVDQLHNEIDRLFGDFFGGFFSPWRAFSGMAPRSADNAPDMLIPHMDLSVTDTAVPKPRLNFPAWRRIRSISKSATTC